MLKISGIFSLAFKKNERKGDKQRVTLYAGLTQHHFLLNELIIR